MSKAFWLSVALVAVFGFSSAQVMARGGGHGGGHHGGGRHGGHHSHHSSHHHSHTGHHDHHGFHHHYHHSNWAHHNRPFSHGWYGRHGGNWGYGWGGWGWGNPWAISTFGATAAWLGLNAAEPLYGNYGTVDNVLTSETEDEPADESADSENENEAAADENSGENNNDEINSEANNAPELTPEQIAAAKQLAISGKEDPSKETSFLPLGVFSIAPQGQAEASALVQLAVSKNGIMRGTYYDLLTDHDQPIRGAVDKKTQQVAFTFGDQGKVTFETSLGNLTQAKGGIVAHFENGKTSNWTLARYEKEPTAEEGNDNAASDAAQESDANSDDASDAPAEPPAQPAAK